MSNIFRTILQPQPSAFRMSHQSNILCLGSCFAENIGNRLEYFKFHTSLNPFGILYNPISMAKGVAILLDEKRLFKDSDLFEHLGMWHSFQHHGSFSFPDKKIALQKMNSSLETARLFLQKTNFLILTLGTSNVFVDKKSNEVVANCHKLPQQNFYKKALSAELITKHLQMTIEDLQTHFPKIKIIITVSPVRHIRDGLVENQISKSRLLLAANDIFQQYTHVHYFPAYELLLDDLRDYRFYKKDMIHPNDLAVDYIWDFFAKTFFDQNTTALNTKIEKLQAAAAHRPIRPQSATYQKFVANQVRKMDDLEEQFPFLDFEKERTQMRSSSL
ncbi:MAG: GSCFA domain-containing protein [Bacteroidota bacterium]